MATRRSARLSALACGSLITHEARSLADAPLRMRKRKAETVADDSTGSDTISTHPVPSTPQKRRTRASTTAPQPAAPMPNASSPTTDSSDVRRVTPTPKPKSTAMSRIANPSLTNAPLVSPVTSRIIASRAAEPVSPSKRGAGRSTTATILEQACAHLIKVDPRMKGLIEAHHCHLFSPSGLAEEIDPFESLASGIISQQVSGAAAKVIKARFVDLFAADLSDEASSNSNTRRPRFPHPSQVAAMPIDRLRAAGLSQRKAEYVVGLAGKFTSGDLSAQILADAPYEEIVERLTSVRGLGLWSVEMFACFGLKRMDVFSLGDLGVQRGMAAFVGRDIAKLKTKGGKWKYMSEKEMREISERFRPYRSLFMWYMWKVEQTDVSMME